MKKFYTLLSAVALSATALAQSNPDRVIIKETNGNFKSYLAERIDEVIFEKIEGDVRADVKVISFTEGNDPSVTVSVKRTPECQSFKIAVVPPKYNNALSDDASAAALIDYLSSETYYEDFTSGQMSGFDSAFLPDVDYTVFTVGYDKFGTACGVSKDTFHTEKAAIVGNPQVKASITDVKAKEFTIEFVGNSDCGQYYLCAFDKAEGGLKAQFEMWGPMFGFNTENEMIAAFAQTSHTGKYSNTWTNMTPATDYEVWIAIQDTKGNYAQPACIELRTLSLGDNGLAEVTITVGKFSQQTDAQSGDIIYLQQMTFTPNSSCAFFRDILIEKAYIADFNVTEKIDGISATGEAGVIEYLKADQPMNPYWNLYETDTWDWNVKPATTYVAYAIAQNAKGEWGTVASKEFTTAGSAAAKASTSNACPQRAAASGYTKGTGAPSCLQLLNKQSVPVLKR